MYTEVKTNPESPATHIFGPVPSRRLGISLGVDLVPYKTCNLNCLYCECGPTTSHINKRQSFADPDEVENQLRERLAQLPHLDYVTFSGSGEPTLSSDLGYVIHGIKSFCPFPLAVLTNGVLLTQQDVRAELAAADLVMPSLDCAIQETFRRINQPVGNLRIDEIVEGLAKFREEYKGLIWLEVFILEGINTGENELQALHKAILRIAPDRVQLNSLDRPPAFPGISPASWALLEKICRQWHELPVEIIRRAHTRADIRQFSRNLENSLLNALRRRPMTVKDLRTMTGMREKELYTYIDILEKEKKVRPEIVGSLIFYRLRDLE